MVALLSIEDSWEVHLNENEDLTLPRFEEKDFIIAVRDSMITGIWKGPD